jgi:hypothetical protein
MSQREDSRRKESKMHYDEEVKYHHTLSEFEKVCEEIGIKQVWWDLAPFVRLMIEKFIAEEGL